MTDTHSTDTTLVRNHDWDDVSFWAGKYKITSLKSDPWRWNKDWEKVLRTLSSADVYSAMGRIYKKESWPAAEHSKHTQVLKDGVCDIQNRMIDVHELGQKGDFATAWVLLEENERKRHLLDGMKKAFEQVAYHQDSRALCPEITISSMLKQRGRAFLDFVDVYKKGKKDAGVDTPFCLPSEWWEKAVENAPQSLLETFAEPTFAFLTLHRNNFISRFLTWVVLSIVGDMMHGSPGMDPVTNFMKQPASFAWSWGKTLSSLRDKPIIRCENCTKSPDEIGHSVKFMLCSVCKSKLDFAVHYCSQACQQEDWRKHKKHCGKSRVSKKLPGTAQDPCWQFPHNAPRGSITPDGNLVMSAIGFASPDSQRDYSPALQRQVSLLTADKDTDYFLFDEEDRPIRFVLHDPLMKMTFRNIRSGILSSSEEEGLEAIAEHLIKVMGQKPGLSRERILGQLESEYGGDIATKVAKWEKFATENGFPGSTFMEVQNRSLKKTLPMMSRI